ncbi:hypothetical protein Tco_1161742 [Tanacetum coccineum]
MGVHTSALDTTFTSDVGSSRGLHLALDNGNSRSFGQFPWNFSLFDLTSNLSNLGGNFDLISQILKSSLFELLGTIPVHPFCILLQIYVDSQEQEDIVRLFAKDISCKLMVYEHNGVTRVGMNRDIWRQKQMQADTSLRWEKHARSSNTSPKPIGSDMWVIRALCTGSFMEFVYEL